LFMSEEAGKREIGRLQSELLAAERDHRRAKETILALEVDIDASTASHALDARDASVRVAEALHRAERAEAQVANLEAVKRLQGRVACFKLALRVRGRQRQRRAVARRVAAPGVLGGTCSSMMLHSLGPSSAVRTMISLHGWSHTPLPPPPIPPKPIPPTLPQYCLSNAEIGGK
jgi:hypothetical protein